MASPTGPYRFTLAKLSVAHKRGFRRREVALPVYEGEEEEKGALTISRSQHAASLII